MSGASCKQGVLYCFFDFDFAHIVVSSYFQLLLQCLAFCRVAIFLFGTGWIF